MPAVYSSQLTVFFPDFGLKTCAKHPTGEGQSFVVALAAGVPAVADPAISTERIDMIVTHAVPTSAKREAVSPSRPKPKGDAKLGALTFAILGTRRAGLKPRVDIR